MIIHIRLDDRRVVTSLKRALKRVRGHGVVFLEQMIGAVLDPVIDRVLVRHEAASSQLVSAVRHRALKFRSSLFDRGSDLRIKVLRKRKAKTGSGRSLVR